MTETTRKPRAKKGVWILQSSGPSGDFTIADECKSTEEAIAWIKEQGKDGITYTVVTVQKEFTVKHTQTVKVTLE